MADLPGIGRQDPHVGRGHGVGDVLGQGRHPGDLHPGAELELVAGDRRADGPAHQPGLHAVGRERADQGGAGGVHLRLVDDLGLGPLQQLGRRERPVPGRGAHPHLELLALARPGGRLGQHGRPRRPRGPARRPGGAAGSGSSDCVGDRLGGRPRGPPRPSTAGGPRPGPVRTGRWARRPASSTASAARSPRAAPTSHRTARAHPVAAVRTDTPVNTRTPTPATTRSTTAAPNPPSACPSGSVMAAPIQPPADDSSCVEARRAGDPPASAARPVTARSTSVPPMTARAGSRRVRPSSVRCTVGVVAPAHEHADPDGHQHQRHEEPPPPEQVAEATRAPLPAGPSEPP